MGVIDVKAKPRVAVFTSQPTMMNPAVFCWHQYYDGPPGAIPGKLDGKDLLLGEAIKVAIPMVCRQSATLFPINTTNSRSAAPLRNAKFTSSRITA